MTLPAHIVAAYDGVSNEKLIARLAEFETRGKALAARIAAGERGDIVSQGVVKGRWVYVCHLERHLNVLRSAWKQENAILKMRLQKAA